MHVQSDRHLWNQLCRDFRHVYDVDEFDADGGRIGELLVAADRRAVAPLRRHEPARRSPAANDD